MLQSLAVSRVKRRVERTVQRRRCENGCGALVDENAVIEM